jgi:hypothetical protein
MKVSVHAELVLDIDDATDTDIGEALPVALEGQSLRYAPSIGALPGPPMGVIDEIRVQQVTR